MAGSSGQSLSDAEQADKKARQGVTYHMLEAVEVLDPVKRWSLWRQTAVPWVK